MPAAPAMPADWAEVLRAELESDWYAQLLEAVAAERATCPVYPPAADVFAALHLTPFAASRVLLLGQDPYHRAGQAHGLCFSVRAGVKPPPSLVNIAKELHADLGCRPPRDGDLTPWARQGVLLLNAVLSVREGAPASHAGLGWERLTDAIISRLSARPQHLVFVLWGAYARKKAKLIDRARHTVVEGAHPSPLSQRLWFGSKPFSAVNRALQAHGQAPIDWQLPS